MSDHERISALIERLKLLPRLDESTYQRLLRELEASRDRTGYDGAGHVRVTVFDAKARDVESLDAANRGRFLLHYVRAPLNLDTARAAEGSKVACVFVNDVCDAAVIERLSALGVELLALRCAGFNHVDMQACARLHINIVRVPAYSPYAVAEFTIALMMMLNRRIHHAYARNRTGNYEEEAGIFFHDMSDKVLTDDVLARLMTFNNVIVTSHQAFLTREALANIADTTLANIGQYVAGKRGVELTNSVRCTPP